MQGTDTSEPDLQQPDAGQPMALAIVTEHTVAARLCTTLASYHMINVVLRNLTYPINGERTTSNSLLLGAVPGSARNAWFSLQIGRSSCSDVGGLAAARHARAKAAAASAGGSAKAGWRHHGGELLPDYDCATGAVPGATF